MSRALPKRRAGGTKRLSLHPGDVFAVPLGGGWYGFGRLTPQKWFAHFAAHADRELIVPAQWRSLGRLDVTESIVVRPIQEGRWPILGNLAWEAHEFSWQPYLVGSQITAAQGPPDRFTDASSHLGALPPEWKRIPKMSMWNEEGVAETLRRKLGVVEQADAADEVRDG